MGRADRISGVFWLCFAIVVIVQSYRLGLGTLRQPGPGFLFFWVNIVLGFMSLGLLVRAWRARKTEGPQSAIFGGQNIRKIVIVVISLFAYVLLLERVGFILVTLLLFVFLLGIIEKKKWWFAVLVATVVTTLSYLMFEIWLQSMLPYGWLEFLRY